VKCGSVDWLVLRWLAFTGVLSLYSTKPPGQLSLAIPRWVGKMTTGRGCALAVSTARDGTAHCDDISSCAVLNGIALHGKPIAELRSVTCHMGLHSLPATRHRRMRPAITPPIQAGTQFTYSGGMEG